MSSEKGKPSVNIFDCCARGRCCKRSPDQPRLCGRLFSGVGFRFKAAIFVKIGQMICMIIAIACVAGGSDICYRADMHLPSRFGGWLVERRRCINWPAGEWIKYGGNVQGQIAVILFLIVIWFAEIGTGVIIFRCFLKSESRRLQIILTITNGLLIGGLFIFFIIEAAFSSGAILKTDLDQYLEKVIPPQLVQGGAGENYGGGVDGSYKGGASDIDRVKIVVTSYHGNGWAAAAAFLFFDILFHCLEIAYIWLYATSNEDITRRSIRADKEELPKSAEIEKYIGKAKDIEDIEMMKTQVSETGFEGAKTDRTQALTYRDEAVTENTQQRGTSSRNEFVIDSATAVKTEDTMESELEGSSDRKRFGLINSIKEKLRSNRSARSDRTQNDSVVEKSKINQQKTEVTQISSRTKQVSSKAKKDKKTDKKSNFHDIKVKTPKSDSATTQRPTKTKSTDKVKTRSTPRKGKTSTQTDTGTDTIDAMSNNTWTRTGATGTGGTQGSKSERDGSKSGSGSTSGSGSKTGTQGSGTRTGSGKTGSTGKNSSDTSNTQSPSTRARKKAVARKGTAIRAGDVVEIERRKK